MRRLALAVALLSFAATSFAQPVPVGKLYPHVDGTTASPAGALGFAQEIAGSITDNRSNDLLLHYVRP